MDVSSTWNIQSVLRKWKKEKKTIVIAEHRLYYLMPIVDRIIYMQKGRILKEYTKEEFENLTRQDLINNS
ncbi:hypothetical protein [uncultured Clostridium sp.]|uniref:hypothetical protein n=1 Tax=uncultured Clostridium sp. TaxID=59620 RepID=UPI0025E915F0|nr:hypothetical protein [uncultured Clostridium sp.]